MKKISALIIDTYPDKKFPSLAIKMVQRLPIVDRIYTLSDTPFLECSNVEFIEIPPLRSTNEYGKVIFDFLPEIIQDDHVLIFQWDGFPLAPIKWQNNFLDFDYIGAPWPHESFYPVGNGGFSLRSKKLIQTLKELQINIDLSNPYAQPEDVLICIHKRKPLEKNGIKFCDRNIAANFSYEYGPLNKNVLGFHGAHNFPHFFSESDLLRYADSIISRIPDPKFMIPYLNTCRGQNMDKLIQASLFNFYNKPNLFKTFQYLSANAPNDSLFRLLSQYL